MKYYKKAKDLAKKIYFGYERLDYMGEKDGYEVYVPITKENVAIGLPISILVSENEARATEEQEECFEIMDYFEGKEPIKRVDLNKNINNQKVILKSRKNKRLSKSRADLVKVQVMVNGRTGQYSSHRWKKPTEAIKILKEEMNIKQGETIQFKDKETSNKLTEDEFMEVFAKDDTNLTVQEYIKKNYKVVRIKPKSEYKIMGDEKPIINGDGDKAKGLNLTPDGEYPHQSEKYKLSDNLELPFEKRSKNNNWISRITDNDAKYIFKRDFIDYDDSVQLEEGGIYNWSDKGTRYYGTVKDGKLWIITENQANELLNSTEEKQAKAKALDDFKKANNIPNLEGSDKQVAIANRYRDRYIEKYLEYKNTEINTDNVNNIKFPNPEVMQLQELSLRVDRGKRNITFERMFNQVEHDANLKTYEGYMYALNKLKLFNDEVLEKITSDAFETTKADYWIDKEPVNFIHSKEEQPYRDKFNAIVDECVKYEKEQKQLHEKALDEIKESYLQRGLVPLDDRKLSVEQLKEANSIRNGLYDKFKAENEQLQKFVLDEETKQKIQERNKFLNKHINAKHPKKFIRFVNQGGNTLDDFINTIKKNPIGSDTGYINVNELLNDNDEGPWLSTRDEFIPYNHDTKEEKQHKELADKSLSLIQSSPQVGAVLKTIQADPNSPMTDKVIEKNQTNIGKKLEGQEYQKKKQELKQEMDSLYSKLKAGVNLEALMTDPNISRALYVFLAEISDDDDILNDVIDEVINLM